MRFNFEGGKRNILTTLGLAATAAPAIAQGPSNTTDKELATNKNKIEHVAKGINNDLGSARKVKEVPEGYVKDRTEENKTFYKKTVNGDKLELAKPGTGKDEPGYEKWLLGMLKNGTASPKYLADMNYISKEAMPKYQKYYQPPAVDIVYTETEANKETDPFAAYAEWGESLYGSDQHLIALLCGPVRNTQSITENGNINTSKPEHKVLIRMVDKMGKLTGECIETTVSELQKVFKTGSRVYDPQLFEGWRAQAKRKSEKEKSTYSATAEDFAKNQ